jgi:hypothetical protein
MNGVGDASSCSESVSASSSLSSSSPPHRRKGVKNWAKVAPRLQRSIAKGSYVRVPNKVPEIGSFQVGKIKSRLEQELNGCNYPEVETVSRPQAINHESSQCPIRS